MESAIYSRKPKLSVIFTGVLLILALLFSISFCGKSFLVNTFGMTGDAGSVLFTTRIFYWLILLITWLFAIKIEKQKLLLWQERKHKFWFYIASVFGLIVILFLGDVLISLVLYLILHHKEQSEEIGKMVEIFKANKSLFVFTCITAGIVEELVFRGYLLSRLALLFKNDYAAIIVSSLLFGLMHFRYGTISNVAGPFFIGLVFAIHYWKFRNIKMLIVFHALWDLGALLLMMYSPHH